MATFKTSKAKENILRRIRSGLEQATLPMPFPEVDKEPVSAAFAPATGSPEEAFATAFINLGGKFVYCDNEQELIDNIHALYDHMDWQQLLCADPRLLKLFHNNKLAFIQGADARAEGADACITGCELLVARTGSLLLSSRQPMGRVSSVFFPVHIVVAYASQLVPDLQEGLDALRKKYGNAPPSMINLNTGPSRTADIEKTLVVGVHGPKEVYCFYVNAPAGK
jgi:L-lactate dehydrogenase complex protein LldG